MRALLLLGWGLIVAAAGCGGGGNDTGTGGSGTGTTSSRASSGSHGGAGAGGDVTAFYSPPPKSCAYVCGTLSSCAETTSPYACPSLGAWDTIPHASSCPTWKEGTYPTPKQGVCSATSPSGDALAKTGQDPGDPTAVLLPDGRRAHPAGTEWVFTDLAGGLTSRVIDVPGTPYVLAVETGTGDHAVRVVDVTALAAGADPVVSKVTFAAPETLNSGLAFVPPGRVFVASADGVLHTLDLDTSTGALVRNDAEAIALPPSPNGLAVYASGVAASPDGTRLVVTTAQQQAASVYSIAAPTYGALLGQVGLGYFESFDAAFDPNDPAGLTFYVSMWEDQRLVAVDISNPATPTVRATYPTDKDPEGMVFLDVRWLAVANANGDTLTLVDRVANTTTAVPLDTGPLHGGEPSYPAYDPVRHRLYVPQGGDNAVVAFDVDLAQTPPAFTRLGRLGTGWWPSGVAVRADGSLVVTTLRGHGGGPIPLSFTFADPGHGDSDIADRMKGSIAAVPVPTPAELAAGDATVAADDAPGSMPGSPSVTCPAGQADFPIPATNDAPSPAIDHIFFILRENKTFDSILGDLGGGVDGEPTYTLQAASADMDTIWHNFREAARTFTVSDNYYTDAVFSTQGHVNATYGRSSDFNERTWIISGWRDGLPRRAPLGGVSLVGKPAEGSVFDWLYANGVPYDTMGEVDGSPLTPDAPGIDLHYPGLAQNITWVDLEKACYAAGRVRVGCDIGRFVYMTLPNDHTIGVSSDNPTPETMCAVNDEATGMMIDAISHSPYWKRSLIIVTEDDPSQGGEHVDGHRTPLILVSPWVKRGYVSHTHVDVASLFKIYAHVFGIPYLSRQVANARIPFDAFTSTPDFTPFEVTHRAWPLACGATTTEGIGGPASPAEEELTKLWDFSREDAQPGLGAQIVRAMRRVPLRELTPEMRAKFARWKGRDLDD